MLQVSFRAQILYPLLLQSDVGTYRLQLQAYAPKDFVIWPFQVCLCNV